MKIRHASSIRNIHPTARRQSGAVLLLVTFSLLLIFGIAAFVIDVGRMYIVKSQLQNAADAGALRGAKELLAEQANGSLDLGTVADIATQGALTDKQLLGTAALNAAHIIVDFSDKPYASSWEPAGAACGGYPTNCHFVRVRTSATGVFNYLAGVIGITTSSASALAVAGQTVLSVAPLGVCAIRPQAAPDASPVDASGNREFGFIRGVAYNIPELNPLSVTPVPMWINPVDMPPGPCTPAHASTSYAVPFVCTGTAASPQVFPSYVYVSTGQQSALANALNSRFDLYQGNFCDPATAPPDTNVQQYAWNTNGAGYPKAWMNPDPANQYQSVYMTQQIRQDLSDGTLAFSTWRNQLIANPGQWGVLWSHSREVNYGASGATAYAWPEYGTSDWPTLYGNTATGYPTTPPYYAGGNYATAPRVTHPGVAERRVLRVIIINCNENLISGPQLNCKQLHALGVGQFFMQTQADFGGSPKKIYGEFAGLIKTPVSFTNVRLYQ